MLYSQLLSLSLFQHTHRQIRWYHTLEAYLVMSPFLATATSIYQKGKREIDITKHGPVWLQLSNHTGQDLE